MSRTRRTWAARLRVWQKAQRLFGSVNPSQGHLVREMMRNPSRPMRRIR